MSLLAKFKDLIPRLLRIDRHLDQIKINQGMILADLQTAKRSERLADYEFKVFSQWGEDGIIQFLTRNIAIKNRTFIEFGVEDFFESNCRFLLIKDQWSGYVIDGSAANIDRLRRSHFYWSHPVQAKVSFITRENIGQLLDESGMDKDVGILSVDIDGVDYHVLEALVDWRARIIIAEYNGQFGHDRPVTVPYDPAFVRSTAHSSNVYYGANLPAFEHLLRARDYALVGVNSVGSNAFFVRRDLLNDRVKEVPLAACTHGPTFREARHQDGALSFATPQQNRAAMGHLPLIDVRDGRRITVADLIAPASDA
jgi:hypothetical protein